MTFSKLIHTTSLQGCQGDPEAALPESLETWVAPDQRGSDLWALLVAPDLWVSQEISGLEWRAACCNPTEAPSRDKPATTSARSLGSDSHEFAERGASSAAPPSASQRRPGAAAQARSRDRVPPRPSRSCASTTLRVPRRASAQKKRRLSETPCPCCCP